MKSSQNFNLILYVHATTLNPTLENFGRTTDEIQSSVVNEFQEQNAIAVARFKQVVSKH